MPDTHINRVQQTVSGTPGTGTITLGAAVSGFRALGSGQNGRTFSCLFTDGTAWEVATGCTYTHAGTTLTRGTLEDSSTGTAISLTSSARVAVIAPASLGNAVDTEVVNFTDLPAAASVTPGRHWTVRNPIVTDGAYGTRWVSDGAAWRPAGPQTLLNAIVSVSTTPSSTTPEKLSEIVIPAGALVGVKFLRLGYYASASLFASLNRVFRPRIGTTGTTSDTDLLPTTGVSFTGSTTLSYQVGSLFIKVSNTHLVLRGGVSTGNSQIENTASALGNSEVSVSSGMSVQQRITLWANNSVANTSVISLRSVFLGVE